MDEEQMMSQGGGMLQGQPMPQQQPPQEQMAQLAPEEQEQQQQEDPRSAHLDPETKTIVALADKILYSEEGTKMIQQFIHSAKDLAAGAAMITSSLLLKFKGKMPDLSDEQVLGQSGATPMILDAVFELVQNMGLKPTQEDFNKSYNLVEEDYSKATSAKGQLEGVEKEKKQGLLGGIPQPQQTGMTVQ